MSSVTENVKICSLCQKENPGTLTACENCGSPLVALLPAPTTVAIPDRPIKFAPPEQVIKLARTYAGSLILVVIGQEQPMIVKGNAQVTLGRYNPGESA